MSRLCHPKRPKTFRAKLITDFWVADSVFFEWMKILLCSNFS